LHTLSFLGGWPGAAIAQSFLRHKSKKASFRFTYWITVIANYGALYWLITPAGSLWLRNVINKSTGEEIWEYVSEFPSLLGLDDCKKMSSREHFVLSQVISSMLEMSPFHGEKSRPSCGCWPGESGKEKIRVEDTEITIISFNDEDYIKSD